MTRSDFMARIAIGSLGKHIETTLQTQGLTFSLETDTWKTLVRKIEDGRNPDHAGFQRLACALAEIERHGSRHDPVPPAAAVSAVSALYQIFPEVIPNLTDLKYATYEMILHDFIVAYERTHCGLDDLTAMRTFAEEEIAPLLDNWMKLAGFAPNEGAGNAVHSGYRKVWMSRRNSRRAVGFDAIIRFSDLMIRLYGTSDIHVAVVTLFQLLDKNLLHMSNEDWIKTTVPIYEKMPNRFKDLWAEVMPYDLHPVLGSVEKETDDVK